MPAAASEWTAYILNEAPIKTSNLSTKSYHSDPGGNYLPNNRIMFRPVEIIYSITYYYENYHQHNILQNFFVYKLKGKTNLLVQPMFHKNITLATDYIAQSYIMDIKNPPEDLSYFPSNFLIYDINNKKLITITDFTINPTTNIARLYLDTSLDYNIKNTDNCLCLALLGVINSNTVTFEKIDINSGLVTFSMNEKPYFYNKLENINILEISFKDEY